MSGLFRMTASYSLRILPQASESGSLLLLMESQCAEIILYIYRLLTGPFIMKTNSGRGADYTYPSTCNELSRYVHRTKIEIDRRVLTLV